MRHELPPEQAKVLLGLTLGTEEKVSDLAARLGTDQALVAAAAVLLAQQELVAIREEPFREWVRKDPGTGQPFALIERVVLKALLEHGGTGTLPEVAEWSGLPARDVGQVLRGLQVRGWAAKQGASLVAAASVRADAGSGPTRLDPEAEQPDEAVVRLLEEAGRLTESDLIARGVDVERARELFGPRNPWVEVRDKHHRWVSLTLSGEDLRRGGIETKPEVTVLTPELLASGGWRDVRFKPYDVHLATEPRFPGKRHPLQRVIADVRQAFLEMGFTEWSSPMVESAFWDFDALFQPQDHPAREMQDTFYVERPGKSPLPMDAAMVERVRATHENGGDTGSLGWQYRWNPEVAMRNVLRTHNTATSIRALAALKRGPTKVFSIGRVFRREAIDYKHLPIFFQVDGIIIDENANFSSHLGTLSAFLNRLGFTKVDFRPDFFPYTEPSAGVYVWNEELSDWFELAGSGIFRPEVTEPLGCHEPVLAWGFGLDRLAMSMHGLKDIRDLYMVDLEWLKGVPQCR